MNKIIDKQFHFFGYEINIRILPPEFRATIERLHILIKGKEWSRFYLEIEKAYAKWGHNMILDYEDLHAQAREYSDRDYQ